MAARSSDGKLQELLGTLKTDGVEALDQLMDAYEERRAERASRQKAILRYVTPPDCRAAGADPGIFAEEVRKRRAAAGAGGG